MMPISPKTMKASVADAGELAARSSAAETAELSAQLGQRVRAARVARSMTMKQLAAESDISLPYLSRVEKGDGNISIAVLYRLALALQVPIENLLADNERYGSDYRLVVELLKRQRPQQLVEIRQLLSEHLSGYRAGAPRKLALIGMRGAGKSTLGPLIAAQLGVPFVELSREVERESGIRLKELFWIYGQFGYRKLERRCLERIIATYPEVVLATGGGIVAEPATSELLRRSFYNIWLTARPEEYFERVMAQQDMDIANPQLRQDAMEAILRALAERAPGYRLADLEVSTSGKSVAQVAQEIGAMLSPGQRA